MKALAYTLVISIALGSCGQAAKKEPAKKTEKASATAEIIRKDTTKEEGVLRIVPPNKENIVHIEDMQSQEMQRALSSYNSGVEEYNKGNIEDALSLFKNSLEYYPENSKASHYIARIYFGRGE
jgi:tetratricopeptide (TPR) repeat protein